MVGVGKVELIKQDGKSSKSMPLRQVQGSSDSQNAAKGNVRLISKTKIQ